MDPQNQVPLIGNSHMGTLGLVFRAKSKKTHGHMEPKGSAVRQRHDM